MLFFLFFTFLSVNNLHIERIGDCDLICNDNNLKKECEVDSDFSFLKRNDIKLGLRNTCIYCKALRDGNTMFTDGPESTYFFDHIIDIFMRKLDGEEFYGQVDEDAKKRNEYKKLFVEKTLISEEIMKEYKKYYDSDGLLYKKYLLGCKDIISVINELRNKGCFSLNIKYTKTTFNYKDNYLYDMCIREVNSRLNKEKQFISYYMIRKGNQYISDYIRSYGFKTYFETHWNRLIEKFNQLYGYRQRIVKLVGESTKNCNSN